MAMEVVILVPVVVVPPMVSVIPEFQGQKFDYNTIQNFCVPYFLFWWWRLLVVFSSCTL